MPFIGSIIFEFIGASFKWVYLAIKHKIVGKKIVGFKQVFDGKKNADFQETIEYGMSNIILGMVIVFIICMTLVSMYR